MDVDAQRRPAVLHSALPDGLQDASQGMLGKVCVCVRACVWASLRFRHVSTCSAAASF